MDDCERSGRRIPDHDSRTVPVYCSVKGRSPKAGGGDQETYYNNMSFQEEQLHYNTQVLFLPSTMVASWIYNWRHKSGKTTR
ncbi:DUF3949 domain-containing protein [Paenibacillus sp. AK002]